MDEENVLVCNLVATSEHPGSIKAIIKQCAGCEEDIWVSISGMIQAGPHAKLVCRDCFNSSDEKITMNMPTEGQIKEIMKQHGKTREEVLRVCQAFCDEVERTGKFPEYHG